MSLELLVIESDIGEGALAGNCAAGGSVSLHQAQSFSHASRNAISMTARSARRSSTPTNVNFWPAQTAGRRSSSLHRSPRGSRSPLAVSVTMSHDATGRAWSRSSTNMRLSRDQTQGSEVDINDDRAARKRPDRNIGVAIRTFSGSALLTSSG